MWVWKISEEEEEEKKKKKKKVSNWWLNRGARGVISLYYSPLEVEVSSNRFDQNKPTTKDTKYRSCLITCMSQALYPFYRIRMGPKELSSYPQNKRDKNPYPWGTTPYMWILFIRHDLSNIYISWKQQGTYDCLSSSEALILYQSHAHTLYPALIFHTHLIHCLIKITTRRSFSYICP